MLKNDFPFWLVVNCWTTFRTSTISTSFIPLAFCKDLRNNKNKHMVKVTFEVICVFLGYCLDHRKTTTQLLGITVSSQ